VNHAVTKGGVVEAVYGRRDDAVVEAERLNLWNRLSLACLSNYGPRHAPAVVVEVNGCPLLGSRLETQ
jgi:hypothetical protein